MKFIKLTEDAEHHVRKWLEWIADGAPEGDPYTRHEGVCHAAYITFPHPEDYQRRDNPRAFGVFANICKILEQRVGDSSIFHAMDSLRYGNSLRTFGPTTHDNVNRRQFFRTLLEQQGG